MLKRVLLFYAFLFINFMLVGCSGKSYTYFDEAGNKFIISDTKFVDVNILGSSYYEFTGKLKNCTKNQYDYVDIIVNFKNDRGEILTSLLDENTEHFNSVKPNEEMTFSVRVIKTNEIKKAKNLMSLM